MGMADMSTGAMTPKNFEPDENKVIKNENAKIKRYICTPPQKFSSEYVSGMDPF